MRIFNNTFLRNNGAAAQPYTEISSVETPNPYVMLRNNIVVDDAFADARPDLERPGPVHEREQLRLVERRQLEQHRGRRGSADRPVEAVPRPEPPRRGSRRRHRGEPQVRELRGGTENLHIQPGSAAVDAGATLTGVVLGDIDGVGRSAPWDIGADELSGLAAVGVGCPVGTAPDGAQQGPARRTSTWATDAPPERGATGNSLHDVRRSITSDLRRCPATPIRRSAPASSPPTAVAGAPERRDCSFHGDPAAGVAARPTRCSSPGTTCTASPP